MTINTQPAQVYADKPSVKTGKSKSKKYPYFIQVSSAGDVQTIFLTPSQLSEILGGFGLKKGG